MFDAGVDEAAEPRWLAPLRDLFGADSESGWMDSGEALTAMAWIGQQVFAQVQSDRGYHDRAGLQAQVEAAAEIGNTLSAVQSVRIAQFAATSVDYAVVRATEPGGATTTRWVRSGTDRIGIAAGNSVQPGDTREVMHPLGFKAEFADGELGAGLCLGPVQASNRVEDAIDAVTKTPRLLAEMGAGRIDAHRLAQVTRELVEAGDAICAQAEEALLGHGVTGWTSARVRSRTRSLVRRLDPAAARTIKRKRAKDAINVFTRPGDEDGTTEVQAVLWSQDALAAFRAVDDLAHELHRSTTTDKTLGECRADAMVDLILGNTSITTNLTLLTPIKTTTTDTARAPAGTERPEPSPISSRVEAGLERLLSETDWDRELVQLIDPPDPAIRVDFCLAGAGTEASAGAGTRGSPVMRQHRGAIPPPRRGSPEVMTECDVRQSLISAAPATDGLCDLEVPGIGVISADAIRAMLHAVGTTFTHSLIDQETGTLVSTSTNTYRPTAAIRRFVVQRDQHCRFPTCTRDAKFCDVDHVVAWPRGKTTPEGLQLLCRHHHRAKHEGGWQVTMTPDGTCTWVSSTGHTYITRPGLTEIMIDADASQVDPNLSQHAVGAHGHPTNVRNRGTSSIRHRVTDT